MTREELLENLALLKEQARNSGANTFIWDISQESFNFVIDSAIKALEQEPTTKNDLGVEKIVDVLGSYTDLDIPYKHKIAEDILNNLPSVTPQEPRKGKWIPRNSFLLQYKCSECGLESEKYNYCPNCGSRNEVEE